ncbi:MAG: putative GTPase [Phycisphaerales bacterium]|nr:putative GTPase [Phycisphaerales bacterium]
MSNPSPPSPTAADPRTARSRGRAGRGTPPPLSVDQLAAGVVSGDRRVLARAVSLIESVRPGDARPARQLLEQLLHRTGGSLRIGITGMPGAGKSTFISRLGIDLCRKGRRVAVLAVDPSSSVSGGSILGDRTRMSELASQPNAYIRPSPTSGTLGGVGRRTREVMLLCEAAGFDVVIVETVGIGQSEAAVADLVDGVIALILPASGDDLQGIKRGLLECVDVIAINKADGENEKPAHRAAADFSAAMAVLHPVPAGRPAVMACSARTGYHIQDVWHAVEHAVADRITTGEYDDRRRRQRLVWLESLVRERLDDLLARSCSASSAFASARQDVTRRGVPPTVAADAVVSALLDEIARSGRGAPADRCGEAT